MSYLLSCNARNKQSEIVVTVYLVITGHAVSLNSDDGCSNLLPTKVILKPFSSFYA